MLFIYYFSSSMEKAFNERVTVIDGDITDVDAERAGEKFHLYQSAQHEQYDYRNLK